MYKTNKLKVLVIAAAAGKKMATLIVLPLLLTVGLSSLSGCTVVAVADAVVSTTVDVAAVAVKGSVAVVDAVIPDGEDEDE